MKDTGEASYALGVEIIKRKFEVFSRRIIFKNFLSVFIRITLKPLILQFENDALKPK